LVVIFVVFCFCFCIDFLNIDVKDPLHYQ
jgi:hypothetical protein